MSAWSDGLSWACGATLLRKGVLIGALALLPAGPISAQTAPDRLFDGCAAQAPAATGDCGDAALAAQALQSGIGLLSTAGGTLPASPSTVGRRVAGSPRIVLDGGLSWVSFRTPDLSRPPNAAGERGDERMVLIGGRVASAVGIFEGFSPVPTVAGILAVDAVGMVQLLRLPGSRGFVGSRAGWGAGVRIGVLRESFSLPGITISAMHHRTGTIRYGDPDVSGARASVRPQATSIRAVVGRDLLAVGLVAGVGWDRYRGRAHIEVDPGLTAPTGPPVAAGPENMRLTRRYLFAGANYTWLVAQLAGELTWARSPFPLSDISGTGSFRPGATELQGAVTVRITY